MLRCESFCLSDDIRDRTGRIVEPRRAGIPLLSYQLGLITKTWSRHHKFRSRTWREFDVLLCQGLRILSTADRNAIASSRNVIPMM